MISEAGYYFTHLESTIDFIENLDASKLTIDPKDFERLLSQAQHQTVLRHQTAPEIESRTLDRLPAIVEPASTRQKDSSGSTSPAMGSQFSADSLLMDFDQGAFNGSPLAASATVSGASPDLLALSKSSSTALTRSDDRSALSHQSSGSLQQFDMEDDAASSSGPEKFLTISDANQLRVGDLGMLLSSYKQLYYENQRIRAELAAAKFDVLKR